MLGRPVVAWNHGGVKEILARMFPFGAVPPGNQPALLAQTQTFLRDVPPVEDQDAFPLELSMQKTYQVYQALLEGRKSLENGS